MKSDIEIGKWLYDKIKGTDLHKAVTGALSDNGRPAGSELEDIVVTISSSEGAGDMQTAFAKVNIYVRDIWNGERGAWERDTVRVAQLCELSKFLFSLFGGDFRVSDNDSSWTVIPNNVVFQDGHTEHVIYNRLFIQISNG